MGPGGGRVTRRQGSNATDTEVFIYTGEGGEIPPQNVVSVLVDPSVTSIPANAFDGRKKLAEVELCDGLVEIGAVSFSWCDHSITKISIPNSLRRVNHYTFAFSLRTTIRLNDGIESTPTLEFHRSSPQYRTACYMIVNPFSLWSFPKT